MRLQSRPDSVVRPRRYRAAIVDIVMSHLRIATHPQVFAAPLPPAEAEGNIDRLLSLPHIRCVAEGDGFWPVYGQLCRDVPARGAMVPDAHVAAILELHGIRTLSTRDRDFAKYAFLRVIDPCQGAARSGSS